MVTIYKAAMALAEEYIGKIETASLKKQESGKSYTHDGIQIDGVMEDGRHFCLEVTFEDKNHANS